MVKLLLNFLLYLEASQTPENLNTGLKSATPLTANNNLNTNNNFLAQSFKNNVLISNPNNNIIQNLGPATNQPSSTDNTLKTINNETAKTLVNEGLANNTEIIDLDFAKGWQDNQKLTLEQIENVLINLLQYLITLTNKIKELKDLAFHKGLILSDFKLYLTKELMKIEVKRLVRALSMLIPNLDKNITLLNLKQLNKIDPNKFTIIEKSKKFLLSQYSQTFNWREFVPGPNKSKNLNVKPNNTEEKKPLTDKPERIIPVAPGIIQKLGYENFVFRAQNKKPEVPIINLEKNETNNKIENPTPDPTMPDLVSDNSKTPTPNVEEMPSPTI